MKILIYCHRIGSRTINFIQNEIRELDKIHEVLLLYHIDKGQNPLEISNKRKVRHYENRHIAKGIKILNSLGIGLKCFKSELDRIISEFKPDVLHIHFGHSAYRVLQSYDFINVPTVVSFHGIDASKWLADKRYVSRLNYCFKNLNVKPIFVSDFMRNNCKNNGMEFDDSFVLYYGTDLKYFERYTKPYSTSPPQFLQVSSFRPKKGHKTCPKPTFLFTIL